MKKRILQFIGSFNQGGSERQAIALTRSLRADNTFEVFAATLNDEGVLAGEVAQIGLPSLPVFPLTSFYDRNFVTQVRRCVEYLRNNEIDLVHTHDFYTNVFGMAAATVAGVPARIASKRESGGMRTRTQEFVENLAFGFANAIVVNSGAVEEHLRERGIAGAKVRTIYNGLDVSRFSRPVSDPDRLSDKLRSLAAAGSRYVTLVANLRHTVKNVPMLLRVAERVVSVVPDVHFVIAGEGELQAELEAMAAKLEVSKNVHFIGRCSDVPALMAISYACVLTSTAEGFANSLIEYMAAGKPVVATNVGGAAEAIVDGRTGYLVGSDDDEAMAGRLLELLADEGLASGMGAEGKSVAREKFSQENQLRATIELYNSVL